MEWKKQLARYEERKDWNAALELMQKVVKMNPESLDCYLFMDYLLMNLLVEEDYESNRMDYYSGLLKKYFRESYKKFASIPEYLFYTAVTASMSEWFMGMSDKNEYYRMFQEAFVMEPDNILYLWGKYAYVPQNDILKASVYAKMILDSDSIKQSLKNKGGVGDYVIEMVKATIKYRML